MAPATASAARKTGGSSGTSTRSIMTRFTIRSSSIRSTTPRRTRSTTAFRGSRRRATPPASMARGATCSTGSATLLRGAALMKSRWSSAHTPCIWCRRSRRVSTGGSRESRSTTTVSGAVRAISTAPTLLRSNRRTPPSTSGSGHSDQTAPTRTQARRQQSRCGATSSPTDPGSPCTDRSEARRKDFRTGITSSDFHAGRCGISPRASTGSPSRR
mmetsp:Transcript_9045/g.29715  ORF Transcript_9045/g.29715 Transcript_9045/m.29715 type:complete len:215 (-) Transcript_9045:217-861(-)